MRENCYNVNEWEKETEHEDSPPPHTYTHIHTKKCERNKGARRVEDKGIKVYKKFPLKWYEELTLTKGTCVPIHYMEVHRGSDYSSTHS
jgi:hypothetical protein